MYTSNVNHQVQHQLKAWPVPGSRFVKRDREGKKNKVSRRRRRETCE